MNQDISTYLVINGNGRKYTQVVCVIIVIEITCDIVLIAEIQYIKVLNGSDIIYIHWLVGVNQYISLCIHNPDVG